MNPIEAAESVKAMARGLGFDLVGVARAGKSAYGEAYRAWIEAGKHGAMAYLAKGVEEREDVTKKFGWAKSVVCVGIAYWQEEGKEKEGEGETGRIARYAWGRDYHRVVEGKLRVLEGKVRGLFGEGIEVRGYCDTGPILEREFAMRAGLGWVGKNTLLIHPRHGSWFLLGELVVSVELAPDEAMGDHCGTCRRCIEACPTEAITPYSVDGSKCISYLTLEHRGEIAAEFHGPMREAGYVVGCDICQEVCPFNRRPLVTGEADFMLRAPGAEVGLMEILGWQEQTWDVMTRGRAMRRAKFGMWQRNAGILMGEAGSPEKGAGETGQGGS